MIKLIRGGVETYDSHLYKGDLLQARVEKLVFGGQGIVVVKAKIGSKWIKGEIKAEETSCQ